ncbi:hypothetical protein LTR22_027769, partial [Elasticomyces elasticus]
MGPDKAPSTKTPDPEQSPRPRSPENPRLTPQLLDWGTEVGRIREMMLQLEARKTRKTTISKEAQELQQKKEDAVAVVVQLAAEVQEARKRVNAASQEAEEFENEVKQLHHAGSASLSPDSNGIHMRTSGLLQSASNKLCNDLLAGEHSLDQHPCYPIERTDDVLERIHALNEARLQRDVTPWVIPSAANMFFSGHKQLDYMGEEIQAGWVRCEPMGVSSLEILLRKPVSNNVTEP